jgi:ketosteroid isomerase-like protein
VSAVAIALGCLTLAAQALAGGLEPLQASRCAAVDADLHGHWAALVEAPEGLLRLSGRAEFRGLVGSETLGWLGGAHLAAGEPAEAASKAYDVQALAELWTQDAVALPPGGPVKRGPELRAGLARMAEAARGTEVLDYREVFEETLVFGDTAVEWGHIEGSERDRASGKVTASRFHLMRILKRLDDGTWRVHRSIFAPAG